MYYLLVEAAGTRQAARIHRDRHQRFVSDLTARTGEHGFETVMSDGDLFLFRERSRITLEPEEVAEATRGTLETLAAHDEHLLDYVVLVDYRESDRPESAFLQMERLLRFTRVHNAAYATEIVASALGPAVETVESGRIVRIVTFFSGGGIGEQSYARFVGDDGEADRSGVEALTYGTRHVAIETDDISRTTAAVEHRAAPNTVYVACDDYDDAVTVIHRVLRNLLDRVPYHGKESKEATPLDETVDTLLRRFADPGGTYGASAWLFGELVVATRTVLRRIASVGETVAVVIAGVDSLDEENVDRVVSALVANDAAVSPCRLVLIGRRIAIAESAVWTVRHVGSGDGDGWERAHHFWARLEGESTSPDRYLEVLRNLLQPKHRQTVLVIHRLAAVLNQHLIDEFFPRYGISLAERARIIKDLARIGVVSTGAVQEVHPLLRRHVDELVDEAGREEFRSTLNTFVVEKIERREIVMTPPLWRLVHATLDGYERTMLHHDILHRIAAGGSFAQYTRHADSEAIAGSTLQLSDAAARMKLYLRDSRGPEQCNELFTTIQNLLPNVSIPPAVEADVHLGLGEYYLARRDYAAALDEAKRSIILHQNAGTDPLVGRGVTASHLLIARIMFAQRRLSDAGQYLGFAREETDTTGGTGLIAHALEAIRLFLVGNLSRAQKVLAELLDPLLVAGYTDWMILLWFLRGRIAYELGDYIAAADTFVTIRDYCVACGMEEPRRTLTAWEVRCRFAVDGAPEAMDEALSGEEETAETLLFRAEGLARRQRFEEALPLLERAFQAEERANRWPRLGVSWENGFASIEDLIIANTQGSSELLRILRSYYAWTLANLGRQEEAVPIFYALTRGNDGVGIDPYTGLYNYLYSSVLPEERSGDRDDRITILGKSVKLIQERTSRIDEYRDKMRYLKDNAWNQQLMSEARQHNLV